MASSSQNAATTACSSADAARRSYDPPLCLDLPAGRMTICGRAKGGSGDVESSTAVDLFLSAGVSDVVAVPIGGVGEAPIDDDTLLLEAVEASYEEATASLSSSNSEFLYLCMLLFSNSCTIMAM